MGWNSPESTLATLERTDVPVSNSERLSKSQETFRNRPESVASALRSDPKAMEVAASILGQERTASIAAHTPE